MKVAMVFPDFSSEKGISKYSTDLIANIKQQGMNVSQITFLNGKSSSLFKRIKELKKCDVIHVQHEYNLLGLYGLPYFLFFPWIESFGKKIIVTMHTVPSKKDIFQGGKLKNSLRKILYVLQNRMIKSISDKIIVHVQSFKDILVNEYYFDGNKIEVFPHAIIEDIKTSTKEKARKELNLSGNVFLLIGTMTPDHGHDIILRQADKMGKTILIASNPEPVNSRNIGKIRNFLGLNKKIVEENGFQKFVRFDLGPISYDKWWKYFAAADLVLLPYRGGVGSGIFPDEMAVKKQFVASKGS